ncbi:hypothetical protein BH11PSE9_BH11PSE9_27810 [soil metagenome]
MPKRSAFSFPAMTWRAVPVAAAVWLLASCGGGGGGSAPVTPTNQAPVAAAKLAGEAVLNATTNFDTTGTADADGTIATHTWNYGDGQTGTADTHQYTATGAYTATYTVTDDKGATAAVNVAVTVTKCSADGTLLASLAPAPEVTVCMQTSRGEMVFELYTAQAPVTVANFLTYVDEGFYAGTLFHRVIPNFVIQGGGYTTGLVLKTPTHPAITLESNNGLKNTQYTLAMARTSVANSATSQFFVNMVDNPTLDYVSSSNPGYAVFGKVLSSTSGIATVESIAAVTTGASGGATDVPVQDVVIRSVVRMP